MNVQRDPVVEVGQVVVIKEKLMPRSRWSLGRIQRVIRAPDGIAKGAELLTKNGVINRPLSLLCPVEISSEDTQPDATNIEDPSSSDEPTNEDMASGRPSRKSKIAGEARRRCVDSGIKAGSVS